MRRKKLEGSGYEIVHWLQLRNTSVLKSFPTPSPLTCHYMVNTELIVLVDIRSFFLVKTLLERR